MNASLSCGLILWTAVAAGQTQSPAVPAVCRVVAPEGEGSASLGSGTLVAVHADRGLVVTNWHVVKDARTPVRVIFPNGYQSSGHVLKMDRDWDLAAVVIWRPAGIEPIPLANLAPRPGEMLTIAGYGSGLYRTDSGRCLQYLSPGAELPHEIVELSAEARNGDSGGPILNTRGELAGVLFGEGGGRTAGSYSGRVRSFLASIVDAGTAREPLSPLPHNGALAAAVRTDPSSPLNRTPDRRSAADAGAAGSSWRPTEPDLSPRAGAARSERPPLEPAPAETTDGVAVANAGAFLWEQLLGSTPIEQAKTYLAIFGIVSLLFHIVRPKPATPAPTPPPGEAPKPA